MIYNAHRPHSTHTRLYTCYVLYILYCLGIVTMNILLLWVLSMVHGRA